MKFKNYFVIFSLFFVLMAGISAIGAVSNDTSESIASQIDFDDAISLSNDEEAIAIDNGDSKVNVQMNDNDTVVQSFDDNTLSKDINQTDDKLGGASSSKSTLNIVNYTNFVKKGKTYYFYLTDSKGNGVANKNLTITLGGKNYVKTTNAYGKVGISVKLSTPSASMKVSFNGDNQYKAFSQTLKFYIDKYVAMNIGNSKLLTNGYLRIYLSGSKNYISNKTVKVTVGSKTFTKRTTAEGFIVFKPKVSAGTYLVVAEYGDYVVSKKIKCIAGNTISPLKQTVSLVNGVPDIDVMPSCYVMADNDGKYTLEKAHYKNAIKRDSQCLYLYGKMSKYTFFNTKDCPTIKHIIKREKWNVIEQALNIKIVKKNQYNYWPSSITVSVKGKSLTYSEVRDTQNTEYTCGPTSASVCSQALRNYYSEKFFQKQANVVSGVNIPVLKSALDRNGFKTSYFYSVGSAVKELVKGGVALIAFLPNHYVSIIDISPDGKKILVSNSYGKYDVGGDSRVPTDWVSVSYFKSKFAGVGLVVKLNYKISNSKYDQLTHIYNSMGTNWIRQNVNERIPDIGL
jgi:hypothetical protein